MTIRDRTTLKGYFNSGDVPTEANFADMLDTTVLQASTGELVLTGALTTPVTVTSSPLTLDGTHQIVIVSNGSTITLPTAVGITGRQYNIIRSGTSDVLIGTTDGQTISGDGSLTLTGQWDSVCIVSDNNNWVRCS